jgi:hypothetical protein
MLGRILLFLALYFLLSAIIRGFVRSYRRKKRTPDAPPPPSKKKYRFKKEDIVDADFEEIDRKGD